MNNRKKRIAALLLCVVMALSLCACAQKADAPDAAVDEYLAQLEGTYVELFPELSKEEYHDLWISSITEAAGADNAEAIYSMLLSMCMADVYGQEAADAYAADQSAMRFDCYFLGGVKKFVFSGNTISGLDENGKEVFSHTYAPVENEADTGFLYYKTEDENAGQFTYFAFSPDTPATTYHIEFRYAEDIADLQSWFEGAYAYWNAAGILENYDEQMMTDCINLFVTENAGSEN